MMVLIRKVTYRFDGYKAWCNSQCNNTIIHNYKSIEDVKALLENNDYCKFTKIKPSKMHQDTECGGRIQKGWVFRISMEIDGKVYKGSVWIELMKLESMF